jgi:hypothetical protein
MFVTEIRDDATNKRVGSRVGQCSLFESSDSNGWSVCLGVIVPIPPHTQNISSNIKTWRNHVKKYDLLGDIGGIGSYYDIM